MLPCRLLAIVMIAIAAAVSINAPSTFAQDTETSPSIGDEDYVPFSGPLSTDSTALTYIDVAPVASARAMGMGGAISPIADDLDGVYYNPAGIGGFGWDSSAKPPTLRKLYFPYVAVAANSNASKLNSDFGKEDGARNASIGSAIVDANAGSRQYGRASFGLGAIFKRTAIVPFHDQQMAAVGQGNGTDLVDLRYRTTSGVAWGTSFSNPAADSLSFGIGGQYNSIEQIEGQFAYLDLVNQEERAKAVKDRTYKFSGTAMHAGMLWRFSKDSAPTLAVVARNAGNTRYSAAKPDYDDLVMKEDLTVGFAMSPKIGKATLLNWVLEANRISDTNVTLRKKLKTGLEMLIGSGPGSYATFGLRAGYNHAGGSAGISANLGIITLEAASQAEDIGLENSRVIERRTVGVVSVNVADF